MIKQQSVAKNPPPPSVGDVFRGRHLKQLLHYVRAVVDVEEDPTYGWYYHVVLRAYSPRKGWYYSIENAFAFGEFSRFEKVNKPKRRRQENAK